MTVLEARGLRNGSSGGRHRRDRLRGSPTIGRQVYWLTSGRIVGALLQAFTLGLLSRALGPSGFGIAAGVVGAVQASIAVCDLGVTPTLLRTRARSRSDPSTRSLLALNARVSFALGLVWALILLATWLVSGASAYLFLLPLAIWVVAEKNTETTLMIPLADGKTLELLASLILRRSIALGLLSAGIHLGTKPLLAYSVALAGSGLIGVTWTRGRNAERLPRRRRDPYLPLLRQAFPFWLATLAVQGRAFDVSIVRAVTDDYTSGVYAAPSRVTGALSLLPNSIAQVALPVAAKGDRAGLRTLAKALIGGMVLMTATFGLIAIFAEHALRLTLGPQFEQSALPLRIILVGLIFLGFSSSLISFLQASGDEWFVAGACLASTAVCFVGVFVGGHAAGADGAAIALSASYILQTVLLGVRMWYSRAHFLTTDGTQTGSTGAESASLAR